MQRTLSLLACLLVTAGSLNAARITWVSFHPGDDIPSTNAGLAGFVRAPDVGYTELLKSWGHEVTRYVTTGTPNTALLNTSDLVIISRSVPSGDYQDPPETAAWNGITAPMLLMNGYILRNSRLGYTTGTGIPDTTNNVALAVSNPSHPIFAGVALNSSNITVNPFAGVVSFTNSTNTFLQRGISVNTNTLAGGGISLATVGTPLDPTFGGTMIGEWFAGATMADAAPSDVLGGHRLVFLTGSREQGITSEGAGILDLTPTGQLLFQNAVNYMAVPEPSTIALVLLGGAALFWRRRKA